MGVTVVQLLVLFGAFSFPEGTVIAYLFKSSINSGVLAMVGGLVIVPVVSVLTSKAVPDNVDEMFDCYDRKITVSAKYSINEK